MQMQRLEQDHIDPRLELPVRCYSKATFLAPGSRVIVYDTMNNTVRGNWIGLFLDEARQAFPSDMSISPDYTNDCILYVTTYSTGLHKSSDCGESWFESNTGMDISGLMQVEIPPDASDSDTLYALSFDGQLYISTNGAANWSLVSTTMHEFDFRNLVLSANFSADRTMYASAEGWSSEELGGGPGVFKSIDGGVTWMRMVDGMTDNNVRKVIVSPDPTAKEVIFALTYSGIEMSIDGGLNWSTIAFPDADVSDLVLSPTFASDQTIFATTISGRIYSSTSGGANWNRIGELGGDPRSLALSPYFASDRNICLFSDEGGQHIYCSTDGGNTFVMHDPFSMEMPITLPRSRNPLAICQVFPLSVDLESPALLIMKIVASDG